jgi:acyl-CoA dehydrogenase
MVDDTFNPRAFMDDEPVDFTKGMEGIDTIPGPKTDGQQTAPQSDKSSLARQ